MKPLTLELQNARTFDYLRFDFTEGVTALTGPNGAGKSTLASAVDAALFGAESRSLADRLSTDRPEQMMTIALTFEHNGETYRVRRTFSGKGRGTTKVDFEIYVAERAEGFGLVAERSGWIPVTRESAAATQADLELIIGLDRETFRASAYLAQGQASVFCEATPGRRKEILASVLGLQVWDGYRERARADLKTAEQSLAVVRAKIEQSEEEISMIPATRGVRQATVEREQEARAALAESESQLAKARERLSKLREAAGLREAAERAATVAEASQASLSARIAAVERQIEQATERLAERPALQVLAEGLPGLIDEANALSAQTQAFEDRRQLEREHAERSTVARQAREKSAALEQKAAAALAGIGTAHCDRCQQILGQEAAERAAESYRAEANDLDFLSNCIEEQELVSLNERISPLPAIPADSKRMGDVHDLIRLGQDAQTKLAALDEVQQQVAAHERERDQMRAELPEREQELAAARERLNQLGPHDEREEAFFVRGVNLYETEIADQRRNLDATLAEIARLDERLARLDRLAADVAEQQTERDRLQQEVELLSHLDRACGPNGVPALILETSAIPQLEAEWNRLLRLLPTDSGDLFEVELHTQRERKTGDGAVDALDVIVYANGHARPYSTYSGGEQMRIAIAQRRALSSLLAHRRGADCPLMILDEPNSLDDQGMSALAGVLNDLAAAENLTVLIVSHDPALRDAFEQNVEIEKVDGRSRIVGASEPVRIMETA